GLAVNVTIVICLVVLWLKGKSLPNQGKKKENVRIEAFIKKFGSLVPRRYSYVEIKKMTNKFNDKLGQRGYGSVYKGKLSEGRFVAVKVLNESKGNGEDFMNEVASISRTSHVNIVSLLGFCFERSKRALVYEFMPHGSLDRFIYDRGLHHRSCRLEWRTLYDIALGIARGLEYLHQGCNTRILHFDIKPHNILLDENFCPKVSDFGLSKLCERKESIISMVCARRTIGYIAPDVFCRNFGGVSYKSDVYSYGMMVLEMVGGRKNIDVGVSQTSEVYFPSWIYKHLDQIMNLKLNGVIVEEEEITRKLIIVSLWCIQSDPSDRPSMTKVIEMLQANFQSLIIPPRPFVSSPVRSPKTLERHQ
ncbi:hypothetical protein Gogos_014977, partial [Gossypium gossypioides]|nr:hypothetical protein [Gossypium gossypioides]